MDSRVNLFESQNLRENESQIDVSKKPLEVKVKQAAAIQQWDNPIEFLMTCIGYAVGIGGVIRFPFLCFSNGGCAYVIAFLVMLMFFGIPLFFLELTISQYSKCGADKVWKVIPLFKGLGLCSVAINTFFCIYFNVLICYSVIYLVGSFMPNIPWMSCDNWWNTPECRTAEERALEAAAHLNHSISSIALNSSQIVSNVTNSTLVSSQILSNVTNSTLVKTQASARQFFYNFVIELSDGIDNPVGLNYKVVGALFFCWMMAFVALLKGIKSLGKVSYFTAIFPYVMLTVLIIRGVTLPGAMKGLEFYILKVDVEKLFTLKTWIDASSQALFCLGIAQGSLLTLGKHNSFNYNHQKATFFIAVLDGFTGVYAGFAIFSVLGFMAESTGQEVKDLAVGGLGLSFIVYPEALALMPFPWIWCILFFMMMITIGFGSLLSMTECCLDTFQSITKVDKKYTTKLRFGTCMFFFVMGLTMCTKGGYYLVTLIDYYTCTLPIIFLATLEAIGLGWFYGTRRLNETIRAMLDVPLNLYWKVCFKFITPVIAIVILIITIFRNTPPTLDTYVFPDWAHSLGWFVVFICLAPLFLCMAKQLNDAGVFEIICELVNPADNWRPAYDDGTFGDTSSESSSTRSEGKRVYSAMKLEKIPEQKTGTKNQIVFQHSDYEN